jgi:hypothetical protein
MCNNSKTPASTAGEDERSVMEPENSNTRLPRHSLREFLVMTKDWESYRFVKNRRKSLAAKGIHLRRDQHDEWLFCKARAVDGDLKISHPAISTCGGFRRRWVCLSHYDTGSWSENRVTWDGCKWSLKVLFIFKFGTGIRLFDNLQDCGG